MDSSVLWSHDLTIVSDASSPVHLLKKGLQCFREGRHVEGLAFFTLAREHLSPHQLDFATALDALTQGYKAYSHTQEELFKASKHFAQADAEQQMQLIAFEHLLSTLGGETDRVFHNVNEPLKHTRDDQPLYALQPSSESFDTVPLSRQLPQLTSENDSCHQSLPLPRSEDRATLPALHITCFGRFEVRRLGKPIALCSSRSGQSILRYLVAQSGHRATSDVLQAMLWPEDEPQVAQRKLHIAVSALRRSLNGSSPCEPSCRYIVCKQGVYSLNPEIMIQTDVDEFLHCYRAGQQAGEERITFYERACRLYTGPFLLEDMYADWSFLQREQLNQIYLAMCRILADHYFKVKCYEDAMKWAIAILKKNRCDESAHRQLIQVYAAQGYRSEAIHQYQRCEHLLREELGVQPMPETQALFQTILTSEPTSPQYIEQKHRKNTEKT